MTDLITPVLEPVVATGPRPMIVADDAHVTYQVYASGKRVTARDALLSASAIRGGRDLRTIHALRGVSFTASEGETIGVVGHNGSGKSTLFRAMTGLIPTSQGAILARDRPVLLGVNAALVPELSGENNIKLGLLAMGYTPEEAAASVDEIADFAELNEFIYHPMRTYSSGMAARLRFAIASAKAHSILLIDEALSVGDRRFKAKSEQRIRELQESAGLVMIVSHSVGSLKDTCERVLWIHKGELVADGPAGEVVDDYVAWTKQPGSVAVGAASVSAAKATAKPATTQPEKVSTDSVRVVDDERTLARRARYRRTAQHRRRRRIIAIVATGEALLLAAGAGAAIALLNTAPAPDESAIIAPVIPGPAIDAFTLSAASAVCEAAEGTTQVPLSWTVDEDATRIALAVSGKELDALEHPLDDELPATAADYSVTFPCDQASRAYTLTAENAAGGRTSSVVLVSRTFPTTPTPTPTETPEDDSDGSTNRGGSSNPGSNVVPAPVVPVVPVVPVEPDPVTPVEPDPTTPVETEPPAPVDPPAEPTEPPADTGTETTSP